MAEGGRLLSGYSCKTAIAGSNPALSARNATNTAIAVFLFCIALEFFVSEGYNMFIMHRPVASAKVASMNYILGKRGGRIEGFGR